MVASVQTGASAAHDSGELTLDRLPRGQSAAVVRVEGADPISRRLRDLGFRTGTPVQVDRVAPLGCPIQYRLHGYRLALRKAEAQRVVVAPTSHATPAEG